MERDHIHESPRRKVSALFGQRPHLISPAHPWWVGGTGVALCGLHMVAGLKFRWTAQTGKGLVRL